jgi:hypothetical protein
VIYITGETALLVYFLRRPIYVINHRRMTCSGFTVILSRPFGGL